VQKQQYRSLSNTINCVVVGLDEKGVGEWMDVTLPFRPLPCLKLAFPLGSDEKEQKSRKPIQIYQRQCARPPQEKARGCDLWETKRKCGKKAERNVAADPANVSEKLSCTKIHDAKYPLINVLTKETYDVSPSLR
jgi:hypothetical protein